MRTQLFILLKSAIADIHEIKHFGLWNNQLFNIEQEQPFLCPAVFIEYNPINWSQLGNNVRESNVTFALHIISDARTGTYNDAQEVFFIIEKIQKKLHRLAKNPTEDDLMLISSTACISSTTDSDFGELMHNIENYTCYVRDTLLIKQTTFIPNVRPDITF